MKKNWWKDRVFGGQLLQRIVGVDNVRTLIWCRRKGLKNQCKPMDPSVAHELRMLEQRIRLSRISEGPHVVGRRVPITQKESERLCEVYDERAFMARCSEYIFVHQQRIEQNTRNDV